MPSFRLPDPYKGWTVSQLKRRCRSLGAAMERKDWLIASLVDYGPGALNHLSPEQHAEALRISNAYRDEDVVGQAGSTCGKKA